MESLVARCEGMVLRFRLPRERVTIGSLAENAIAIPFRGVSRVHAAISPAGGGVLVEDRASRNGVWLDGRKVPEALLLPGGKVRVGPALLTTEEWSTADLDLALTATSAPPGDSAATDAVRRESGSAAPPIEARVLALVRDLERAGEEASGTRRRELLGRGREVLGAESLLLLSLRKGEAPAIVENDGALPSDEVVSELARSLPGKSAHCREVALGGRPALLAVGEDHGLLALFEGAGQGAAGWEGELLGILRERLCPNEARPLHPEKPIVPSEVLKIPAEMVVGESAAMAALLRQVAATAATRTDVLLQGESGVGKELFARMIHASGPTSTGPFVAVNCAAIPNELLEAELFGVQARAATGVDARPGQFRQAEGGSIFLDEIGDLAEPLQAKLLRVLEEHEVLPVGASHPVRVNVRVISASNRDLLALTREGHFRADLYYRLARLKFHLPPLRERREDIPQIVTRILPRVCEETRRSVRGISRKALSLLMEHDWPGNVRELENELRRAVLTSPPGGVVDSEQLAGIRWQIEHPAPAPSPAAPPAAGEGAAAVPASPGPPSVSDHPVRLDEAERQAILQALEASRGNRSLAARLLGISRNGLAAKLKRHRLG